MVLKAHGGGRAYCSGDRKYKKDFRAKSFLAKPKKDFRAKSFLSKTVTKPSQYTLGDGACSSIKGQCQAAVSFHLQKASTAKLSSSLLFFRSLCRGGCWSFYSARSEHSLQTHQLSSDSGRCREAGWILIRGWQSHYNILQFSLKKYPKPLVGNKFKNHPVPMAGDQELSCPRGDGLLIEQAPQDPPQIAPLIPCSVWKQSISGLKTISIYVLLTTC
ncbi:uncharacterized protein LOC131163482 [Malania oleifera]|uniref:uncharacterized protein LOC131163482 n=1 Tax=Malania oleifera TaxID=397392 RepID=UPI0025AE6272|nr:uncharacterized protein LOC131163482 [Malania oleifera]